MKKFATLAVASLFAAGITGVAMAQEPKTHTETTTKQTGPGPDMKQKSETVTGTVKSYSMGKSIKVEGPGGKNYSFDLDENARVDGNIAEGQPVKVTYYKSSDGREHVTVLSEGKGPHGAHMMASGAAGQAAGERVHSESTTKEHGPGPDMKTKSEVVIGNVKKYEAGKKITVEGPKNHDYTFDLDEAASINPNVAVGQRVKVTYTKTDSGQKVTMIEPAS
jgi:ribosomal protein S17